MSDWTAHARLRSAQRHITPWHIDLAVAWGCVIPQGRGRTAYHLGDRDAARARRAGVAVPDSAIGVAVVMADEAWVVTVVRSPDRQRLRTRCLAERRRRR